MAVFFLAVQQFTITGTLCCSGEGNQAQNLFCMYNINEVITQTQKYVSLQLNKQVNLGGKEVLQNTV